MSLNLSYQRHVRSFITIDTQQNFLNSSKTKKITLRDSSFSSLPNAFKTKTGTKKRKNNSQDLKIQLSWFFFS